MSLGHGEETHLLEEGVRPTLMIGTPGETSTVLTSTKDRPQPPSNPPINGREGINVAVLEVGEPASEDRLDDRNDPSKTVSNASARLLSDAPNQRTQS